MAGGIYKIMNRINSKTYIGQAIKFEVRDKNHFRQLRGKYHRNFHMQSSFNKHKEKNFAFEPLGTILVEDKVYFAEREQHWIDYYVNELGRKNVYNEILTVFPVVAYSEERKLEMSLKRRGEKAYQARLTWKQVGEIRKLYSTNEHSCREIGEKYGVGRANIEAIIHNKIWKDESYISHKRLNAYKNENNARAKASWEQVKEIRTSSLRPQEMAMKYGVAYENILDIIYNETWIDESYVSPRKKTKDQCQGIILNQEKADNIRKLYKTGKYRRKDLMLKFGIRLSTFKSVLSNKTWHDKEYTPPSRRNLSGEESDNTKLTWAQVKEIRKLYQEENLLISEIANKFGISCISHIITNRSWHDEDYVPIYRTKVKLNWTKVGEIRNLCQKNHSNLEIANIIGISTSQINRVVRNYAWYDENYVPPSMLKGRGKYLRSK